MRSSLFLVLAVLALAGFVAADTPKPKRPLCKASLPIDGTAGKTFVSGTATSADQVTVAVQGNIVAAGFNGAVYIYWWDPVANSLSLKQTLNITDDPVSSSSFGRALSLENNILVVGHPQWVDPLSPGPQAHGRAIVYQTLSDSAGFVDFFQLGDPVVTTDPQDSLSGQSNFGAFVAQRNGTLSVSSPQCCQGNRIGAVYTYRFNSTLNEWVSARVGQFGDLPIPAPTVIPLGSGLGTAVTFTTQMFITTAPGLSDATNSAIQDIGGILYLNFDISTGAVPPCSSPSCQAKLATWGAYTPDAGAECGAAMSALDSTSNRVSIGCPGNRNASGSVLIGSVFPPSFSISNRINPPTVTLNEGFGAVLAQQYDSVIIGNEVGDKVYVYERVPIPRQADSYVNTQVLTEASRGKYGVSLALDGNLLAVGSYGGFDVYNCGNPVSGAISALPLLGLLLICLALLL